MTYAPQAETSAAQVAHLRRPSWRQRLWVSYVRQPHHPMKRRLERWLAQALRLRRATLPIPGPAVLDLPMGEHLTYAIALLGCYERTTLERILELCRGAFCFLDVGAQFGQFTLAVSAVIAPYGKVIAVEPNPRNYLELCRNLQLNRRRNVHPVLAAAAERESLLRLGPGAHGNSGATTTCSDIQLGEMIVPAFSLADLLHRLEVSSVDVMKLDVEGFEPHVLRGLFANGGPKPLHIFFEHFPDAFSTCEETLSVIRDAGYAVRQVNGEPFLPSQKPLDANLWATLDVER